ncbi:MAG: hypothetical protein A3J93_05170 [Candidatus Magasanikbacteria bacterium RIFOXYC2_FULL_42_28]|uniref:Uncharacterized protein n=1 Tax=Candidatus Magasanikbacteria bacterium RIFOXYC2_FULL_42_28 TaxID=1798704 RepID=A0A1F6NV31_9BACT|nr:MAG: hypothetical protein A3J93_05170 [Candidatus Magasanikbacteria bacterium RIFOXYC2_FULL_42_28]
MEQHFVLSEMEDVDVFRFSPNFYGQRPKEVLFGYARFNALHHLLDDWRARLQGGSSATSDTDAT